MSEPRIAAIVCEGQTDVPIFRAVIQEVWPSVDEVRSLQPQLDEMGRASGKAGWTEVRSWCKQRAMDLDEVLNPFIGDKIDLLVVAMDFDIACDAGVARRHKTLGAKDADLLRDQMRTWLCPNKKTKLPPEIVLSTPVMAVEAWIVAALFPREHLPEQIMRPCDLLVDKKKLRVSPKDGEPWKEFHRYGLFAKRIAESLKRVRKACPELGRTCSAIERRRNELGD